MGIEHIQLISDEEMQRKIAEYQIDAGLVTAENFATRSPAEQETIKDTLFEKYARNVNPYVALFSLEFVSDRLLLSSAKPLSERDDSLVLNPGSRHAAYSPTTRSGSSFTIRSVSMLTRTTRLMRSTRYRGFPCSAIHWFGSFTMPVRGSSVTWYRSMIHSMADLPFTT